MRLRIGVLVVGSLDWESKDYEGIRRDELNARGRQICPLREKWRLTRMASGTEAEYAVRVPIRYGRKSASRGNTYTMVFSPEYAHRLGKAKAITCERNVSSIDDLIEEAEELWAAESKKDRRSSLSASWGCIALVIPGDFLDHADVEFRQALLRQWHTRVSLEKSYGEASFSAKDVAAAGGRVIDEGRLQIPWPKLLDGQRLPLNILLATVTNPKIKTQGSGYPSVEEIAAAWKKNGEHAHYFYCNRLCAIETPDDDEISRLLT